MQNLAFPGSVPNPVSPTNAPPTSNRSTEDLIRRRRLGRGALEDAWLGKATLTSITAYRDNKENVAGDTDATLADISNRPAHNFTRFRQFSQEFQYGGRTERLNWQVGAFYSHELLDTGNFLQNGPALGPYLNVLSGGAAARQRLPTGEGVVDAPPAEHSEAIYTQENSRSPTSSRSSAACATPGSTRTWRRGTPTTTPPNLRQPAAGGDPQPDADPVRGLRPVLQGDVRHGLPGQPGVQRAQHPPVPATRGR